MSGLGFGYGIMGFCRCDCVLSLAHLEQFAHAPSTLFGWNFGFGWVLKLLSIICGIFFTLVQSLAVVAKVVEHCLWVLSTVCGF